jgi:ribosomal protein S18 acetylase RimI-like enzyme
MGDRSEVEVSLRRATPRDADAVAEVWLRSRKASVPAVPAPIHDDDDVRAWLAQTVSSASDLWVAERSRIVAMMLLEGHWIEQLYVDPSSTGRGIGSRLIAEAKVLRPERLDLWTFAGNTGARRFYERHGFSAVETTDGNNEERAPDVHYLWQARPS